MPPHRLPLPVAAGGMPKLDAKALRLTAATKEQQKALGEHLYMHIARTQPQLAGKITGMLLELGSTEELYLIEDTGALGAKVNEALLALLQARANYSELNSRRSMGQRTFCSCIWTSTAADRL